MYSKEIVKLCELLDEAKVPYVKVPIYDGWQIRIGQKNEYGYIENCDMDAVCHGFSYGHDQELLEIMGGLTEEENELDGVLGYLTAETVAKRFIWCWNHHTDIYKEQ